MIIKNPAWEEFISQMVSLWKGKDKPWLLSFGNCVSVPKARWKKGLMFVERAHLASFGSVAKSWLSRMSSGSASLVSSWNGLLQIWATDYNDYMGHRLERYKRESVPGPAKAQPCSGKATQRTSAIHGLWPFIFEIKVSTMKEIQFLKRKNRREQFSVVPSWDGLRWFWQINICLYQLVWGYSFEHIL